MWSAALPCRRYRLALLCSIIAAAAVVASPLSSAASAPKGQEVWAVALPSGVKTVKPAQLSWFATRGVTTVVVFGVPQRSLQPLAAAASRVKLNVIAPKRGIPKAACKAKTGALRTCAALAPSVVTAVRLARRGLVDFVVVRVNTVRQLRMLRGTGAKRSRIVAVLPLSAKAAWRAGVVYASTDPALELAVSFVPGGVEAAREPSFRAAAHEDGVHRRPCRRTRRTRLPPRRRPLDLECLAAMDIAGRFGFRLRRLQGRQLRAQRRHPRHCPDGPAMRP